MKSIISTLSASQTVQYQTRWFMASSKTLAGSGRIQLLFCASAFFSFERNFESGNQRACHREETMCRFYKGGTLSQFNKCRNSRSPRMSKLLLESPFALPKAPEDWRTPGRFARSVSHWQTLVVLDCGGPPPLSFRSAGHHCHFLTSNRWSVDE